MDLDRPQSQLDSYLRISQPSWIGYMDLHICMCYNKPCSNGIFWNIPDAVSLLGTSGKDSFLQPALPVTRDKNWQKSTYFTWASSICTGLFPSPGSKFPKPAASGELSHNTGRSWSQLISVYLTRVPKKVANLSSKEMHLVGLEWVLLVGVAFLLFLFLAVLLFLPEEVALLVEVVLLLQRLKFSVLTTFCTLNQAS